MIEDVVPLSEIAALEADIDELLDTAPPELHGTVDKHGRPSPFGGYMQVSKTGVAGLINHPLMMLDSALTTYGHPDILSAVAAINGPDFIAMNEGIFHKAAHEGDFAPLNELAALFAAPFDEGDAATAAKYYRRTPKCAVGRGGTAHMT